MEKVLIFQSCQIFNKQEPWWASSNRFYLRIDLAFFRVNCDGSIALEIFAIRDNKESCLVSNLSRKKPWPRESQSGSKSGVDYKEIFRTASL